MEERPDHPVVVTERLDGQWDKVALLLMGKLGTTHVVITSQEIQRLPRDILTAQQEKDGLHIRLVSEAEAMQMLCEYGELGQE